MLPPISSCLIPHKYCSQAPALSCCLSSSSTRNTGSSTSPTPSSILKRLYLRLDPFQSLTIHCTSTITYLLVSMLPSSPQRPYQVPGYSNPGGNASISFQADASTRYPFPQPGGFSSLYNSAGYPLQENGYRLQTFTERTVSTQGRVELTLREGNTLDGGRRLEDRYVPGPLDPQQYPNKPHKKEILGNTSNDIRIKGFPSKLYK